MASILGRRRGFDDTGRAALRDVLADPIFELLPLKSLPDQIPQLPRGALVSVTASPAKGIDATVDWAARLQADGFRAIPHLSARMIADRATLAGLLGRARD
ncbi:MAG: methylenetetrahydrofolate reductase, partial [Sphingomonadales bacterium]|nr:methylenetetrahydrofolate reductase [Sphingomonadales bacterium]